MDNEKQFAIKLADNEKKTRDKSLLMLRGYISGRSKTEDDPFNEEDMVKLWKGLHYCMWMCDKALIQEELTEKICSLINCFNNKNKQVMLFVKIYFQTIIREWNGIDKWRIDKFMMLMRHILRATFSYVSSQKWDKELVNELNKIILEHPLSINDGKCPDGVCYHLVDIYIEELAKFGQNLKPIKSVRLIEPFIKLMATSEKKPFVMHIKKRLFEQIIECSDIGIDPEIEKELEETQAFGLQLEEEEDKSEFIIKFDYKLIAKKLFKIANSKECIIRNQKLIYDLVKKFKALSKGIYPIDDFNNLPVMNDEQNKKFIQRLGFKTTPKKKAKKVKRAGQKKTKTN